MQPEIERQQPVLDFLEGSSFGAAKKGGGGSTPMLPWFWEATGR
jgi:hypothetical protein